MCIIADKKVTIYEHRAPTDESVKILRELEHEAKKKVDKAIRINSIDFECVVQIHREFHTDTVILAAKYRIGRQNLTSEVRKASDEVKSDLVGVIHALVDEMAKDIAEAILKPVIPRAVHDLFR